MNTTRQPGRFVAWCAFVLGVAASVAANVAHAKPDPGARLASAFAPVALLLTVEIMSRVPWPAGGWWSFGRFAGTGAVALVAAVTSYSHMYGLLRSYGETPFIAAIQPACVDGLMVVASLALLALGNHTPTERPGETAQASNDHTPSTNTSWLTSTERDHTTATPARVNNTNHPTGDVPTGLMMSANLLAASHRQTTGQPIGVDTLADRLGVDTTTARRLLTGATGEEVSIPARINGHTPVGAVQP